MNSEEINVWKILLILVESLFLPEVTADFMKVYPKNNVIIEGHTSKLGSAMLNQTSSQNHSQASKDILVNKCTSDESIIMPMGYGLKRLLLEKNGEYIHARNRRIVAGISSARSFTYMKWTIYSVEQCTE